MSVWPESSRCERSNLVEGEVALGAEPPGEVVVAVEEHPRGVDLPRPVGDRRQAILLPFVIRGRPGPGPMRRRPCRGWPGSPTVRAHLARSSPCSCSCAAPVPLVVRSPDGILFCCRIASARQWPRRWRSSAMAIGRAAGVHSIGDGDRSRSPRATSEGERPRSADQPGIHSTRSDDAAHPLAPRVRAAEMRIDDELLPNGRRIRRPDRPEPPRHASRDSSRCWPRRGSACRSYQAILGGRHREDPVAALFVLAGSGGDRHHRRGRLGRCSWWSASSCRSGSITDRFPRGWPIVLAFPIALGLLVARGPVARGLADLPVPSSARRSPWLSASTG